jgi:hypothetical protein
MKIAILFAAVLMPVATHAASDLPYFQQFLYQETEDADGNASTRFLMGSNIDISAADPANHILANIQVYLLPDSSYVIKYDEMYQNYMPILMHKHFQGSWSVPDQQLVVGDVATGGRAVSPLNGLNAVQVTFTKDLNTAGLAGKTAILEYGFSNEKVTDQ